MKTRPLRSVLAAGIAGNARLHEKLDGQEASRVAERCRKRIERSVESSGGAIFRSGADETLATFETADTAVQAALEMQRRVADLPPVSGVKVAIRVGISAERADRAGKMTDDDLAREAARLAGIARSGQILTVHRICGTLPDSLRLQMIAASNPGGDEDMERGESLVEVVSHEAPAVKSDKSGQWNEEGAAEGWLRLRYGGSTFVFDRRRPIIDMGRDGACDLVIRDPRASRRHAMIKRRGNVIVLVDQSTNGTYVTIDGASEQYVKRSEFVLQGGGVIAFAASASASDADCAEFECA